MPRPLLLLLAWLGASGRGEPFRGGWASASSGARGREPGPALPLLGDQLYHRDSPPVFLLSDSAPRFSLSPGNIKKDRLNLFLLAHCLLISPRNLLVWACAGFSIQTHDGWIFFFFSFHVSQGFPTSA